jgi:NADPH-dependent 2,4-dienoyl-CoA reductase/sulfur reductase-like enzyme/rhodanese-related sulfurtransferase
MTRKIVIVGGVAGGATAAARARRCNENADIILLEKDEHVSFANCGLPYYIGGEIADRGKLLLASPAKFRDWFNVDVRTRHEVLAIDRQRHTVRVHDRQARREFDLPYDRLIIAPGATPIVPPMQGTTADNVFTLRNLADTDRIKRHLDQTRPGRAVVIGAGFIGLEMVEMLHKRGMQVSLVELAPQVLPPLDPEMAHMVQTELARHGVDLHLGNGLKAFEQEGGLVRRVVLNDGTKLDADFVMMSIGVRPNVKLAQEAGLELGESGGIRVNDFMQTTDPLIYAVGDAVEYRHGVSDLLTRMPLAGPANRAGRIAGEHAASDQATPMPPVLGTAIVRVFDAVAALTGCNRRCAQRMGKAIKAVWVPARHHVGYYPGSQEMILKLIYEEGTGKVLGAQIVGGAGVDKRIDVLATAIRFGATVSDLTTLDLAYAPPFGAAKDPVHMAAFAAENDLRGIDRMESPDLAAALPGGFQLVDVRTPEEWNAGHLATAVSIPLHELRDRLDELDPALPVATVCRGGQRSYYASRILRQKGFADVRTISGGMVTFGHAHPEVELDKRPAPSRAQAESK